MNEDKKIAILQKIKEYDTILLGRHIRPDGDALGSTMGLQRIIQNTYPDKTVLLCNSDASDTLAFLNENCSDVEEETIRSSLAILLDTATTERASNPAILKAKEVIKIDHHIDVEPYGDLSWVEHKRSSVCEMVTEFYRFFQDELVMDKEAATLLYLGMVTDSGRFRFSSTSGETMRLAGLLLDQGIEIEPLYARLDLDDFSYLKFKSTILNHINMTEHGVAWLYVDRAMQKEWNLTREQAGDTVVLMSSIKGSIFWMALIENEDGTIKARLRSRFMTINELAEKYHGGGHDRASGATCYSKEEMEHLIQDADALIKEYKETHEGWI